LSLASPYILQETAMAHQQRLPFLIFKTPEVTLQGVTNRNLYIEIQPDMPNGRPVFRASKEMVMSSLRALRARALEHHNRQSRDQLLAAVGKLSAFAAGTYAVGSFLGWLSRPNCFGTYYYLDGSCKHCSYKPDCKAEKARELSRRLLNLAERGSPTLLFARLRHFGVRAHSSLLGEYRDSGPPPQDRS
jgi:hypothetical protein